MDTSLVPKGAVEQIEDLPLSATALEANAVAQILGSLFEFFGPNAAKENL